MKVIIIFIYLSIILSCSESYYIQYSASGTATEANIIYLENGYNIESVESLPWSKNIFVDSGESIGLSVKNMSDGVIDAWIMFIGNGDWIMYERQVHEEIIIIKGVIHTTL